MYQSDPNKKKLSQKADYGYTPARKTFQAQPVSAQPQANLGAQATQMVAGKALDKGMNAGMEAATPYVKQGFGMAKDALMGALAPSASTAATGAMQAGVDAGIANAMTGASGTAAMNAAGAAGAGGMGAMGAGLMAAAPWAVGGALLADKLGIVDIFNEGGKVEMTPEKRAAFYNLQISNGKMTPELAHGALMNEFGMRPGIAQSLIQSEYNTRQTPTGPTSLIGNTPQVPDLPQSRQVPMVNAPVNPYDETTQVPRDLQNPPVEREVTVQPRKQEPMAQAPMAVDPLIQEAMKVRKDPTVANTAAMEDAYAGQESSTGLGPLALALLGGYAAKRAGLFSNGGKVSNITYAANGEKVKADFYNKG